MNSIDNNQFEVRPNSKSKRKITTPCPNAYLNPALDLLANDDPMCNTAMEIVPNKKRKRTKSCDIITFENTGLDLGIGKAAVNEFLVKELENVRKNMKPYEAPNENAENNVNTKEDSTMNNVTDCDITSEPPLNEPIYANVTDISMSKAVCQETTFDEFPAPTTKLPCFKSSVRNQTTDTTMDMSCPQQESINNLSALSAMELSSFKPSSHIEPNANTMDLKPTLISTQATNDTMDFTSLQQQSTNEESVITELSGFNPDISEIEMDSGISVMEQKSLAATTTVNSTENETDRSKIATNVHTSVSNQIIINNTSNINLSFIDRLALDSPNLSNQSLFLDDDLNESNIMEVKTITIITKKKRIINKKKNTNPFLDANTNHTCNETTENPFLSMRPELEYNGEVTDKLTDTLAPQPSNLMPRRLFNGDTNSTISTVNESMNTEQNEYENIDGYRSESPIYENLSGEFNETIYNKQSKILGHDVSRFSSIDIMNLNKRSEANCSNDSSDSRRDLKHQILKAGNKLSKKVFKTLKKTFKGEKVDPNVTLNPYEVPRKPPKQKTAPKESGIENPALNLDNSDEIEIEELEDEEHQYETVKTLRNTRLNMNVTPLRERGNDNADCSQTRPNTPGKKVRFDSTLNQEKVITGNSFDYGIQSPGFDAKIDKYHDELENCINERKFLQQNM